MCNINTIIFKKGVAPDSRALSVMEQSTGHSFLTNNDGEGVYFSGTGLVHKSNNKISLGYYRRHFMESRVTITHQRLSTSGFSKKYHHPFVSKEFVMVHNGVVSAFASKKASDTHNMFWKFIENYRNIKGVEREEAIVAGIKKTFDSLSGSYSIVLYDKVADLVYYFKCWGTSIYFSLTQGYLMITTQKIANLLPKHKDIDVQSHEIYRVDKDLSVVKVGEINGYNYYSGNSYSTHGQGYDDWTQSIVQSVKREKLINCDLCAIAVNRVYESERDDMVLCEGCDLAYRGDYRSTVCDSDSNEMDRDFPSYSKPVPPNWVACCFCSDYHLSNTMVFSPSYQDYCCKECEKNFYQQVEKQLPVSQEREDTHNGTKGLEKLFA